MDLARLRIDIAEIDAADAHHTDRRIGQPAEQLGQRRLARPRLTDDRHIRPGGDVEIDVVEHALTELVVGLVGEADTDHVDRQRTRPEDPTVDRLDHVDRLIEQIEDLSPAGEGGLGLIEYLADLAHRVQDQGHQEQRGDDRPLGQSPTRPVYDADGNHCAERDRADEVRQGEHQREEPGCPHVGLVQGADRGVQALACRPTVDVGTDDRRSGHGLGHLGEGLAHGGTDRVVGPELSTLEEPHDRDQRQEHHDRHQRELPGVDGERSQRHDDDREIDQPRDRSPLGELGERLDISGDPRHQYAALGLVVMRQAQRVDVVEGPGPESEQRVLRGVQ